MGSKLNIGLIGAAGKLGRAIAALAAQDPSLQIAAIPRSAPEKDTPPSDLFLDVSSAAALSENLKTALSLKKPLVIGTTGLSASDFQKLKEASLQIPVFYSANFSLGMAILRKIAAEVALRFHHNAHIDLIETHHAEKKDAPSGSALLLAQAIQEAAPRRSPIPIHSLRSGKIVGEHTLIFNAPEERIALTHEAHSRDAFARGALAAARFLSRQSPGLYTMDHLLAGN